MLVVNCHNLVKLFDASCWPTTHGGKKARQPSIFRLTQRHTNNWEVDILFLQCIFPSCTCHLGMDKFTKLFLMANDTMSLLEISLDVHVYILLQCWQLLWAVVGHMCNVNMCIMSYKWLCSMGSRKSSFIIAHGVGMKFNICWCVLKPLF
jgi:hypothetical protein